ncbi:MAG: Nuclear import receptor [Geoglossum simile]|nr:MAG: Nuclear import receptor [Geoglossum simile]
MASNGVAEQQAFAPVLAALATLQGNVERTQKSQAHDFLERFQKSPEAWAAMHSLLRSDASAEAKIFAATTLKGKITYDIDQLPRASLVALRDSILSLLASYRLGPRPIRTQLCVCLANLAIQMIEWKDVLEVVVSALGNNPESGSCVLEFLRVLPEEVTEGRKITLTEEELDIRTNELLGNNAVQVLRLLTQYSQSSASAAVNPQLMECITSWLREIPVAEIVKSPLLSTIVNALSSNDSFEAAVECLCAIFKETRDVDENIEVIRNLFPRVAGLRPKIAETAIGQDMDAFRGITRVFAEAGEAWVVLIARMPEQFRPLVESVLECAARDSDREAISLTFKFWYELKLYLVLEKYIEARVQFVDIFSQLVDIMIKHLEFPVPEGSDETDLFDGDHEQEERFREFRHQMGDVLKDCCEVIGVTDCLGKSFELIQKWVTTYGRGATDDEVPHWQELEAPLFSMRAMGRMVDREENIILPQLMPLIVMIPDHEKVRFAAIMVLGRYTEWTSGHPEFLEPQLNYIIAAFNNKSKDVVRAAAMALKFFCVDCKNLLVGHAEQLEKFYESILDKLPPASQEEVTEGVASVVSVQPTDKLYEMIRLYCNPIVEKLMAKANAARDEKGKLAVADHLQLLTLFIQVVNPYVPSGQENPAVKYCQEVFPILGAIVDNFNGFTPICERICRCWRYMLISYRTAMQPLLPQLAEKLVSGFANSRLGCFLWVTSSVVREFSDERDLVDPATTEAIYQFFEQQCLTMLRALDKVPPEDLPDVIEDFFRLLIDALLYYPNRLIPSPLFGPIFDAALTALTLQQVEPLRPTLHYLRDVLSYGGDNPPTGALDKSPIEIQQTVKNLLSSKGEILVQRILTGLMFNFPKDNMPDASGVLIALVELLPNNVSPWILSTIQMLPAGSVSQNESDRVMGNINKWIGASEFKKVRYTLQDFTTSYRRRNVAPRDGLGRLEAARFRFSG